jgi:protease I
MRVAILATDGVEESELLEPRKALQEAGAETTLFAPKEGSIQSFNHHDKASSVNVDVTLAQADPSRFDAVLLPGGALNADTFGCSRGRRSLCERWTDRGNPSP